MHPDNRILASVALFGELYDQRHDIYDLVADFLRAAIIGEARWIFTSSDANKLLRNHFDFELPEAVIRNTIRNRLVRSGFCAQAGSVFNVLEPAQQSNGTVEIEFSRLKRKYDSIFESLYKYAEKFEGIDRSNRAAIREYFSRGILGEQVPEIYSRMNSAFIVANQNGDGFQDALNQIREGLVIYSGIHSQPNLNELGTWNTDLVLFLDTELIFSLAGYNGIVYQTLFDDFYSLVREINTKHHGRGGQSRISLRYFQEVADEIDSYFKASESVLKGYGAKPLKPAMQAILNGCGSVDDIFIKKAKLLRRLETEGIFVADSMSIRETIPFNVESSELLGEITREYGGRSTYDENDVATILQQFTRVNAIRHGMNDVGFERCAAVIITGDGLTRSLANHPKVKFADRDFPFAIDLDFVTNKFWFKLNKGFRNKQELPKSFDVVTRSQIVLAAYGGSAISDRYSRLVAKVEAGEIDRAVAVHVLHGLRTSPFKPEDIIPETVPALLELLGDPDLEHYSKELEELKQRAERASSAETSLGQTLPEKRRLEVEKRKLQNSGKRRIVRTLGRVASVAILSVPGLAALLVFLILYLLKSDSDSLLTFIGTVATFLIPLGTLVLLRQRLRQAVRRRLLTRYRKSVSPEQQPAGVLRLRR